MLFLYPFHIPTQFYNTRVSREFRPIISIGVSFSDVHSRGDIRFQKLHAYTFRYNSSLVLPTCHTNGPSFYYSADFYDNEYWICMYFAMTTAVSPVPLYVINHTIATNGKSLYRRRLGTAVLSCGRNDRAPSMFRQK